VSAEVVLKSHEETGLLRGLFPESAWLGHAS
jgi:hypothetical protein